MRKTLLPAALVAAAIAAAPAAAEVESMAHATFVGTDGEQLGTATLTETPNGVIIGTDVRGLPEGVHAFHIHETGECDPATGFESAGGHHAPGGNEHGYREEGGPHAGDMPNQTVGADGVMRADVFNPGVTLARGEANTLFDDDGSALVIHSGADDYTTQPAGDAGGRIACAVVED